MNILIISARPDFWLNLTPVMQERGFATSLLTSLQDACAGLRQSPAQLVILDLPHNFESLRSSMEAVHKADNRSGPRVKIALVNNLPDKDFKELCLGRERDIRSLPTHPSPEEISVLLNALLCCL
jgi:DNA-binding NtrC family response regulator